MWAPYLNNVALTILKRRPLDTNHIFNIPKVNSKLHGQQSFTNQSPTSWYTQPPELRHMKPQQHLRSLKTSLILKILMLSSTTESFPIHADFKDDLSTELPIFSQILLILFINFVILFMYVSQS